MSEAEIMDYMHRELARELVISLDQLTLHRTSRLRADLGIDSVTLLDLCTRIESDFQVTITDADLEDCETVGDVMDLIVQGKGHNPR